MGAAPGRWLRLWMATLLRERERGSYCGPPLLKGLPCWPVPSLSAPWMLWRPGCYTPLCPLGGDCVHLLAQGHLGGAYGAGSTPDPSWPSFSFGKGFPALLWGVPLSPSGHCSSRSSAALPHPGLCPHIPLLLGAPSSSPFPRPGNKGCRLREAPWPASGPPASQTSLCPTWRRLLPRPAAAVICGHVPQKLHCPPHLAAGRWGLGCELSSPPHSLPD